MLPLQTPHFDSSVGDRYGWAAIAIYEPPSTQAIACCIELRALIWVLTFSPGTNTCIEAARGRAFRHTFPKPWQVKHGNVVRTS